MRRAVPLLLLLAATAPLAAAVAGVPEAPRPGPRPAAWFAWGNDNFGGETGENLDDDRTNAFTLGAQRDGWVLGLDHSMLTNHSEAGGQRGDQLTLALGREWTASASAFDQLWLSTGVGGRSTANWGGQWLQDRWHDANGFNRYTLPEDRSRLEATAWTHAEWLITGDQLGNPDLPGLRSGRVGLDLRASGMVTSGGEGMGSLGASVVVLGAEAHAMLGVAQELRVGSTPNPTAERTADHERGTWLTYGFSAGGWFLTGGWALGGPATWGAVGWQWGREPARAARQVAVLEGGLAVYQGYALGVQYRWQPAWLIGMAGRTISSFVDYRFGRYPGPVLDGSNQVVMRQGLAGLDWEPVRFGDATCSLAPFVQAGAGMREERLRPANDTPRFPNQAAQRAVVQGTLGLRCMFAAGQEDLPAYGFSLVYDHWQTLGEATASNPDTSDCATYQHSGGSLGLRFNARVAW